MEVRKIVVVVEEEEIARTAMSWALHNVLRYNDIVTLLHVFPANKKKIRLLRLKGFQLALSFKDMCVGSFPNTKIEIVVTEGDEEGGRITDFTREIGASTLVAGLHDQSFLYSTAYLVGITGVLAPILEENVFRGFLMVILTKWVPTPILILISAAVFSTAHLTPGEFPQLFILGTALGLSYAQTRNLLTPITIHAFWNSGVILLLTILQGPRCLCKLHDGRLC